MFFVILLSSFIFCFSFIFYAGQSKDAFRTNCATRSVELQKNIIKAEKLIFNLNPVSTAYRVQIKVLQAALIVAPPVQKPQILAQLDQIYSQQNQLDLLQKRLLSDSQMFIDWEYQRLIAQAKHENHSITRLWDQYLQIISGVRATEPPILAIRPDSTGGKGPNYEFDHHNIHRQNVVLKWQNIFTTIEQRQSVFNPKVLNEKLKSKYSYTCRVGIERTTSKWQLKINLDKF